MDWKSLLVIWHGKLFCVMLNSSCLRSNNGHKQPQPNTAMKIGLIVLFALEANTHYDHVKISCVCFLIATQHNT